MARNEEFLPKLGTFKNEESNEITNSLKLFAAMALKEPDNSDFRTPIDIIKRDFENNGVHVDEFDILRDERDLMSPVKGKQLNNLRDERDLISPAQGRESYGISKGAKKVPKKKPANGNSQFCVFCENNKEPYSVVRSHAVRDTLGKVVCPKLRRYKCPLCHAFGDNAHTVKYCPKRPIITMEDTILAQRLGKLYPFPNIIKILNV